MFFLVIVIKCQLLTGNSLSEALIFASTTNPQYDDRLFIKLQIQYMKISSSEHGENMLCTEIVFDIQNNLCSQHVLPMFCKMKSFWQRFTCMDGQFLIFFTHYFRVCYFHVNQYFKKYNSLKLGLLLPDRYLWTVPYFLLSFQSITNELSVANQQKSMLIMSHPSLID